MKILVTCPPMIGMQDHFREETSTLGWDVDYARVQQTLSEPELIATVPGYDGWIIGDDPATEQVLAAGKSGKLKSAIKWGVGVDNVDFEACKRLGITVHNTPGMFDNEVADIAIGYLIAVARDTFRIDREVRAGGWPKYSGTSLQNQNVGLLGFGNIGQAIKRRLDVMRCKTIVYDPFAKRAAGIDIETWPNRVEECRFLILCCALTPNNHHMINSEILSQCTPGVSLVNVARGPLVDESALANALNSGKVASAALDVFEEEPLPMGSPLRKLDRCIFGSHNASNTKEAVLRTSFLAIEKMAGALQAS